MNNLLIPGEAMIILEKTTLAMAFLAAAWKKDNLLKHHLSIIMKLLM